MGFAKICAIGLLLTASTAFANEKGMGYVTKSETVIYTNSTGIESDETVKKHFPLIAYDSSAVISGKMASESVSDGRMHVRYWKNGADADGGENTGWIEKGTIKRFLFDCCGDPKCSGIKAVIFKTRTYTDCFNMALEETIEKITEK